MKLTAATTQAQCGRSQDRVGGVVVSVTGQLSPPQPAGGEWHE